MNIPIVKSLEEVQDGSQTIFDVTALIPLKPGEQISNQHLDAAVLEGFRKAAASMITFSGNGCELPLVLSEKSVQYRLATETKEDKSEFSTVVKFLLYDLNFTPHSANGEELIRCDASFRGRKMKGKLTAYLTAQLT